MVTVAGGESKEKEEQTAPPEVVTSIAKAKEDDATGPPKITVGYVEPKTAK